MRKQAFSSTASPRRRSALRPGFESDAAARVLGSGRTLSNAANAAAIIAGFGFYCAGSGLPAAFLCLSLALWAGGIYFALRVRIDEGLLRALSEHAEDDAELLDRLLLEWKLVNRAKPRDMGARYRGALRLWRIQIALLILQLLLLAAAFGLRLASV